MQDLCSLFQDDFLIVGVGSPLRSDDRAGLLFCNELFKKGHECLICEYGIENCLDEIYSRRPRTLIIVDAALFDNGSPGDVVIASEESIVSGSTLISTHNIPISALTDLLKSVGAVKQVYLVGIYPKILEVGVNVSKEVLVAVENLVNEVTRCLESSRERGVE